jgi:septum formation protein
MNVILASTSPRRKEILSMLSIEFEIFPVDIDESIKQSETPYYYVHRLAIEKAEACANLHKNSIIIAGDVTIDLDGIAYAKAESPEEAKQMLGKFSGKTHYIRNGYAVYKNNTLYASGVVTSLIEFKDLSNDDILDYLETNEWQGKAGAYAIQGKARKFINNIQGSYYDILGLPIYSVGSALLTMGYNDIINDLNNIFEKDKKIILEILRNG